VLVALCAEHQTGLGEEIEDVPPRRETIEVSPKSGHARELSKVRREQPASAHDGDVRAFPPLHLAVLANDTETAGGIFRQSARGGERMSGLVEQHRSGEDAEERGVPEQQAQEHLGPRARKRDERRDSDDDRQHRGQDDRNGADPQGRPPERRPGRLETPNLFVRCLARKNPFLEGHWLLAASMPRPGRSRVGSMSSDPARPDDSG
jgi:hypothetical protein